MRLPNFDTEPMFADLRQRMGIDTPPLKCYRVTTKHDDGAERSGIYDATSPDEARTMVERNAAGVEDIIIVSVECLDQ